MIAPARSPARPTVRRLRGSLGLAWMYGSLHAAVFSRQALVGSWTSLAPVRTLEGLVPALDEALAALNFGGAETFLVLGHEDFVHRTEAAPAFSEAAAWAYLRGRAERYQKEHGQTLWVGQRTASLRQDSAFLLHLLPADLYDRLNRIFLERRLDLTRILPLVVPLQLELATLPPGNHPVLVAAETGDATTLIVAKPDGQLVFARTFLASWRDEPARVGVEVNRSLLYAKQQFGTEVDRIWLLGGNEATAEVRARCGAGREIATRPTKPLDWLQAVASFSRRSPVNLVAGHLRKARRQAFFRRALFAACWLALGLVAVDTWKQATARTEERRRLAALRTNEAASRAEQGRLAQRNRELELDRVFDRQADDSRLPPVPGRFLAYLAGILPKAMRLTDFSVQRDSASGGWSFRLAGEVEADAPTAQETVAALQQQLAASPFRTHIGNAGQTVIPSELVTTADLQNFSLEGGMLENPAH